MFQHTEIPAKHVGFCIEEFDEDAFEVFHGEALCMIRYGGTDGTLIVLGIHNGLVFYATMRKRWSPAFARNVEILFGAGVLEKRSIERIQTNQAYDFRYPSYR